MAGWDVEIIGLDGAVRRIEGVAERGESQRPVWERAGELIKEACDEAYAESGLRVRTGNLINTRKLLVKDKAVSFTAKARYAYMLQHGSAHFKAFKFMVLPPEVVEQVEEDLAEFLAGSEQEGWAMKTGRTGKTKWVHG